MADDAGDKSEPPTPRRRMEARNRGQIARSQELNAAVSLLGAMIALALFGHGIWSALLKAMTAALGGGSATSADEGTVLATIILKNVGIAVAPFMLSLLFVGGIVLFAQVGWLLTLEPLTPKFDKFNPINGIKRIFSTQSLVQLVQNVFKLALVVGVTWLFARGIVNRIVMAGTLDYADLLPFAAGLVFDLGVRLAIILLVLALFDYAYQRHRHEKQLKMTKEEVKEEMKRMDGDPVVKRRRREVQLRLAAERIKSTVPQADVVVTNPTHYAVAIRYDAETMAAPTVVAKGADYMALRIREIAAAAGVPIVEKPQLARMLYAEVESGREIPEKLYRVVAEVLAYIYELSGRNLGPAPVPVN